MQTLLDELIEQHKNGIEQGYILKDDVVGTFKKVVNLFGEFIKKDIGKTDLDRELMVSGILINQDYTGVEISPKFISDCHLMAKDMLKGVEQGRIIKCRHIWEDVFEFYKHGYESGISTGFVGLDQYYRIAPRELCIVTGIPGHGKSEILDQILVNMAKEKNMKFGYFSPENFPYQIHVEKLACKFIKKPFHEGGTERMNIEELGSAVNFINDHFCFLEPFEDNVTVDSILYLIKQAIEKEGIQGAVIDPWNEICHQRTGSESETEYIGQNLSKIRMFARKHNIVMYVVAHPKKITYEKDETTGHNIYNVPTAYDINGSANWFNKADNILCAYRNPDNSCTLYVQKIKFKVRGRVGSLDFLYDKPTGIYTQKPTEGLPNDY